MGSWKDAPIVEGGSWKDAPIVGEDPKRKRPKWEPPTAEELAVTAEIDQMVADQVTLSAPNAGIIGPGMNFNKGLPFIGSWVDELYNAIQPGAGDRANAIAEAYARQNPKKATAAGVAGSITGAIPLAVAAAPVAASSAAPTLGARAAGAGILGAGAGAAEGMIQGAGQAEGDGRAANAQQGAVIGGMAGGALGVAAPFAVDGVKKLLTGLRGSDIGTIRSALGISPAAARVVKQALDVGDMAEAEKALARAGDNAMLADAGQPARELLDASANAGGQAGKIARDAVDERAAVASADMQKALDGVLGAPQGQRSAQGAIRTGTKDARKAAYDAAYSQPIDYSSGRGQTLERLMRRVPQSAIKRANELMRLEGVDSKQIMASIADDGAVTFQQMPDVRQLDYITRALNDVADQADGQGKLGGTTALGNATKNLSASIRRTLKGAVPEYANALDVAADAISQTKAIDLGYEMLRPGMRREAIRTGLEGASKAEIDAAKQGLRSYIDDTLANVARTATDPNVDIREGVKLIRDMSSRASMDKMRTLLGKKAAQDLADELDKQAVAFELRSAIATNSKTGVRQAIQGTVEEITAPGVLETLASGEPLNASKRFVQVFTGDSAEAQALRQSGIYEEIARALTETRGAKARSALKLVEKAMSGQTLTEQQAAYIGRVTATSGFLASHRQASKLLTPQ